MSVPAFSCCSSVSSRSAHDPQREVTHSASRVQLSTRGTAQVASHLATCAVPGAVRTGTCRGWGCCSSTRDAARAGRRRSVFDAAAIHKRRRDFASAVRWDVAQTSARRRTSRHLAEPFRRVIVALSVAGNARHHRGAPYRRVCAWSARRVVDAERMRRTRARRQE